MLKNCSTDSASGSLALVVWKYGTLSKPRVVLVPSHGGSASLFSVSSSCRRANWTSSEVCRTRQGFSNESCEGCALSLISEACGKKVDENSAGRCVDEV